MEAFTSGFAGLLDGIVGVAIHCFEFIGVIIIVAAGGKGVIQYGRKDPTLPQAQVMVVCL